MISSTLSAVGRALRRVSDPLSYILLMVASVLAAIMMFLVASSVFMRYFLNSPILGDMEMIQFLLITLTSFSLAYCASQKSHVSVNALVNLLPPYVQRVVKVLVNTISLVFLAMVAWYSAVQGSVLWHRGHETIMFGIPLYPFAVVLSFGFAVFTFVIFVDLIDSLAEVFDV